MAVEFAIDVDYAVDDEWRFDVEFAIERKRFSGMIGSSEADAGYRLELANVINAEQGGDRLELLKRRQRGI